MLDLSYIIKLLNYYNIYMWIRSFAFELTLGSTRTLNTNYIESNNK